ncbi:MAG: DNA primase [bacterium]
MVSSPIDEIKSRLDIVEVIGSYLKLQKTGANYRASCPFHSEKKPSFFVSPTRQTWRCFGCSIGGDIFQFIMQIEGVEFGDALRLLAQRAGVELKRQDPQLKTERRRLYEICELTTSFFEKQLEGSKVGQEAQKYLLGRKITKESIKKWRLGYAPDSWRGLSDFLVSQGYRRDEIEKAGLAIKSEKGGNYYDRFRGRIIFPVFDINSQVIGFGGRILESGKEIKTEAIGSDHKEDDQQVAKYLNTAATLLYDKSQVLYGLDKAKMAIRKNDACILVEGYVDVIMASQVGSENVVAVSGTALTPYHLRILKRYTENLIISFDMDTAGSSATKRGIELAQTEGFNIKILLMPEGMDPADVISQDPQEWQKRVAAVKSIMEFYFESAFASFDSLTIEGKKQIAKDLLPAIKAIPNRIEQSYWLTELAKRIAAKEEDLRAEMEKGKSVAAEHIQKESPQVLLKSRKEMLEERLLALALSSLENLALIGDEEISYLSPVCAQVVSQLKVAENNASVALASLTGEANELANRLLFVGESEGFSSMDITEELRCCLKEFKLLVIRNKLAEFSRQLEIAERGQDYSRAEELLQGFNSCSHSLREIEEG